MAVVAPLNNIFDTIFDAIGSALTGGIATTSSGTPMIGNFPDPGPVMTHHAAASSAATPSRPAWSTRGCSTERPATTAAASLAALAMCRSGRKPARACSRPGRCAAWRRSRPSNPRFNVAVNVRNTAPGTRASANVRREPGGDLSLDIVIEQIEGGMARHIGRGEGLAPTLERRYGLNPAAGSFR